MPDSGYYVAYNPIDKSVWFSVPKTPGRIIRMDLGSNPPETCHAEAYEPPYYNPKVPGQASYLPRGIDVDSHGLVWVGLAGSGQLASFDRSKCKVLTGPESFDGQHCVEGWTIYDVPGPQLKNVAEPGSADFLYGDWVDRFNTLRAGCRRSHRQRHWLGFAAGVPAGHTQVGGSARSLSSGLPHAESDGSHRRSERGLERPRTMGRE